MESIMAPTREPALESSDPSSVKTGPKPESKRKRPLKEVEQKVKCSFCPRSFSTPRWNTNHCNQEHLDLIKATWLECKYCHLFLPTTNSLSNHLSHIHEPKKKAPKGPGYVKCPYCDKKCYPTNHLYKHCLRFHREKVEAEWLHCSACPNFFQSQLSLDRHMGRVHKKKADRRNPKNFLCCPFCPELPSNLNITIAKHCTDKHFDIVSKIWPLCDVCGQYVPSHLTKAHNRLHDRGKCQFCEFVYSSSTAYNYVSHANVSHSKEISMLWVACPDCHIFYPTEEGVQYHRKLNHGVRKVKPEPSLKILQSWEKTQCRYCGIKFDTLWHFKRHLKVHFTQESPDIIKCLECRSVFQTERSKASHLCQPITFLSCQFCSEKFLTEGSYQRHAKEVHSDQISLLWVGCQYCADRFESESKLSKHLCKRSVICPFCSDKLWCLKRFWDHANEKHPDEVLASWSFDCASCQLRFPAEHHRDHHWTEEKCSESVRRLQEMPRPLCLAMPKTRLSQLIREKRVRRLPEGLEPRCTVCDVMLNSPLSWMLHQNRLHGYSQVFSTVCDFQSATIEELTKHLEDIHPDDASANEWIRCEKCGDLFPKLEVYERHRDWFHWKDKKAEAKVGPTDAKTRKRRRKSTRPALKEDNQNGDHGDIDLATTTLDSDPTTTNCQETGDDVSLKMDLDEFWPTTRSDFFPKIFAACEICGRDFVDSFRLKNHLADFHLISQREGPKEMDIRLTIEGVTAAETSQVDGQQSSEKSAGEIVPQLLPSPTPSLDSEEHWTQESTSLPTLDQSEGQVNDLSSVRQNASSGLDLAAPVSEESTCLPEHEHVEAASDQAGPQQATEPPKNVEESSYDHNSFDDDFNNDNNNRNEKYNNGSNSNDDDVFVYTHSCKKCNEEFASKLFLIRHLYKVHLKNLITEK